MTASVVLLVTSGCAAPAATSAARAPIGTSVPVATGAAAPGSTGDKAEGSLEAVAAAAAAGAGAVGDLGQQNTPRIVHWTGAKGGPCPGRGRGGYLAARGRRQVAGQRVGPRRDRPGRQRPAEAP